MDIARRLEKARKAIGFTLKKVEEKTGIGSSSLSDFENAKREPKFSELAKLADVYKKGVEFFLSDEESIEPVTLWREVPTSQEEKKATEAEFNKLCEQYHKLEVITSQVHKTKLPQPDVDNPKDFTYGRAEAFARKVQNQLCLGNIPSASLKKVLEEKYFVKIFHLQFSGSAISSYSPLYENAVLLNSDEKTKQWRRNYDLAHELFHLCTMNIFKSSRLEDDLPTEDEEKLANAFASVLLMPEEALKERIELFQNDKGWMSLDQVDDIAREFGVSIDALTYRIANIYRITKDQNKMFLMAAKQLAEAHKPRDSEKPNKFPERYYSLAIRALNEGKLSLMQFAKYMDISYKEAQEYLIEDEDFTDEKISISVA
jgi:Zn-dependent peptidase ImmA (M78 family)/transcriptional regulator with XRE-family HTH domain